MNESDFEKVTLHEPFQLKDRRNPNIHHSIPPCFILSSNNSTTTDFLGLDEKLSGVISKLNLTSIHSGKLTEQCHFSIIDILVMISGIFDKPSKLFVYLELVKN